MRVSPLPLWLSARRLRRQHELHALAQLLARPWARLVTVKDEHLAVVPNVRPSSLIFRRSSVALRPSSLAVRPPRHISTKYDLHAAVSSSRDIVGWVRVKRAM